MVRGVLPVEPKAAKAVEEASVRWDFQLRSASSMVDMKEDCEGMFESVESAPSSSVDKMGCSVSRAVPFEDRERI
jgi:hypothetical protein